MMWKAGPILHFRGQDEARWLLAVVLVVEPGAPPPSLELEGRPSIDPELFASSQGLEFWRYDFAIPLGEGLASATYTIGGQIWTVALPGVGGGRRIAYSACNGNDDESIAPLPPRRDALWEGLLAEHAREPFHLLLHGGDQLYADTIWDEVEELGAWRRRPWREGNTAPFTPSMEADARSYYTGRYLDVWNRPPIAQALAMIPSSMMWDDHDTFDGWGSWPEDRQASPVYCGLGRVAREHFALFQLGACADNLPSGFADPLGRHFAWAFRAGPLGLLAPDLRSERTRKRVMGEHGWHGLEAALASLVGCRHVIVLSSVPLVAADLSWLERAYSLLPGHRNLEDDLRDQWQSATHRDEWHQMLDALVTFASRTGARVTAVSGEIHMGAFGVVESDSGIRIHQLTSSGIVHLPPPGIAVAAYEWIGRQHSAPGPGISVRVLKIPGHGHRYLRERNWLSLDCDGDGRFEAAWHTERGRAGHLVA